MENLKRIRKDNSHTVLFRRTALSTVGFFLMLALILFLPAGIGWRKGWLSLIVFFAFMALSAGYLWLKNPEIFIARAKVHQGTKPWDKGLLALLLASFFAVFTVAGFDAKFGWSSVPAWLVVCPPKGHG